MGKCNMVGEYSGELLSDSMVQQFVHYWKQQLLKTWSEVNSKACENPNFMLQNSGTEDYTF